MGTASALKRALVKLLLALAREFAFTLSVAREAPDEQVKDAFRKVIIRIQPDKPGGSVEHTKTLNDAWSKWQGAQRARGRPSANASSSAHSEGGVARVAQKKPAGRHGYRQTDRDRDGDKDKDRDRDRDTTNKNAAKILKGESPIDFTQRWDKSCSIFLSGASLGKLTPLPP